MAPPAARPCSPIRKPPRGERIAVIGAGPAGLTYAALVADGNSVTVFEKNARAGGSFRYAGKAPLYQEVEASEKSFERYVADLVAACEMKGVVFRLATDVNALPGLLAPFDRIVVASGAEYRFGLGAHRRVDARPRPRARAGPGAAVLHRRRCATGSIIARAAPPARRFERLARPGQTVIVIGDAVRAGKSKQAIASAFEAALLRSAPVAAEYVYLSAVESVENVVFSLVPRPVITGMIANAIPVAMRPYSIAVAAFSSLRNLMTRCMALPSRMHPILRFGILLGT